MFIIERSKKVEKKSSKGILILVGIVLVIVGLCGGYSLGKGLLGNKENTNNPNEQEKKEDTTGNGDNNTDEEVELNDAYIKKDISKKASIILTNGTCNDENDIFAKESGIDDVEYLNLTDTYKLNTILHYNSFVKKSYRDITYEDVEMIFKYDKDFKDFAWTDYKSAKEVFEDENAPLSFNIFDANIIEKDYYEIFGTKVINQKNEGCPTYRYIKEGNFYIENWECGDIVSNIPIYYKNKYTIKENYIYVYTYIATYNSYTNKMYKEGYEYKLNENNYLYDVNIPYVNNNYQFDKEVKTNYEKYAKYRLVFEKDSNGIYHYKDTEKID